MEAQLRYYSFMNDLEKARDLALRLRKHKGVNTFPPYAKSSVYLHTGLVFAASVANHGEGTNSNLSRRQCRRIAQQSLRSLQALAGYCGSLTERRICLLEAEIMTMNGSRSFESLEHFDIAIRLSAQSRGYGEEGLACERAAVLCTSMGHSRESNRYLRKAFAAYQKWGARAKTERIQNLLVVSEEMYQTDEKPRTISIGSNGSKETNTVSLQSETSSAKVQGGQGMPGWNHVCLLALMTVMLGTVQASPLVFVKRHHHNFWQARLVRQNATSVEDPCAIIQRAVRAASAPSSTAYVSCSDVIDVQGVVNDSDLLAVWSGWTSKAPLAHGGWPPAMMDLPSIKEHHFMWDEMSQNGSWHDDTAEDRVLDPLTSTLSQSGGLHRKLHQHLSLPFSAASNTVAHVLLILPSEWFINIEDAVEYHDPHIANLEIWDAGQNIDQEEPSFASPAHAVVIAVTTTAAATGNIHMSLEWDVLLHLRYPAPLQDGDYSLVTLPAPLSLGSSPRTFGAPRIDPPLTTWIAVGHEHDFIPVILLTTLASMLGSLIMLQRVARLWGPGATHV